MPTTSLPSDLRKWTLTPEWDKPPLNMNDRLHRMAEYERQQTIRQTAKILARNARIPALERVEVAMIWTVPTRGRRDAENPVATLKPFCDGLVDAGIVPDDTPEYMTKLMPVIEYAKGVKAVRFEVSAICGTDSRRAVASHAGVQVSARESHQRNSSTALRRFGGDAA